jgi:hypothetical protein
MRVGEKTSLAKMVSTRSADVEPGAESFEEVVTGGETSRAKGAGGAGEGPGLGAVKATR